MKKNPAEASRSRLANQGQDIAPSAPVMGIPRRLDTPASKQRLLWGFDELLAYRHPFGGAGERFPQP